MDTLENGRNISEIFRGKDINFDKAMDAGKVQMMRLKNIDITIKGKFHRDKNLFDLFLDHQDDKLFDDYVREHNPTNAKLLMQAEYVIVFIAEGNHSRFAGVYKILGEDMPSKEQNEIFVKVELVEVFKQYGGRIEIEWGGRAAQRWLQWFKDKKVTKIDEGIIRLMIPFNSYNKALLTFKELKNIIDTRNTEWYEKLKNVKGVYGISDSKNGKLYVGAAYGYEGIWDRWKKYVETKGHGGNKMLVDILTNEPDYVWDSFQWFILETFPMDASDNDILEMEDLYKRKLCSREFGYNEN